MNCKRTHVVSRYGDEVPGSEGTDKAPDTVVKQFTQDELNNHIATARRQDQQALSVLKQELDAMKANGDKDITSKLSTLQQTHDTNIKLIKDEHEKLSKKGEARIKELTEGLNALTSKYHGELVATSITSAAVKHNAFNPAQLDSILRPKSKVVDEIGSDGKPTGVTKVMVTLPDVKDSAKSLTLSTEEAVKYMFDNPEHWGNLFKSHLQGVKIGEGQASGPDYTDFNAFRRSKENAKPKGSRS
jgi:hypothetical protein